MKKYLSVCVALFAGMLAVFASPARGSVSLVQSTSGVSGAVNFFGKAFSTNVANGDLVIGCFTFGNNTAGITYSMTDSASNSYAAFVTQETQVTNNNDLLCFWTIHAGSAAAITVTGNASGGGSHTFRLAIYDYASTTGWPASPVDKNAGASSSSSVANITTASITPSQSGTLIFSALEIGASGVTSISTNAGYSEQPAGGTAGQGWASSLRADSADNQNGGTSATSVTYTFAGGVSAATAIIQNFKPNVAAPHKVFHRVTQD